MTNQTFLHRLLAAAAGLALCATALPAAAQSVQAEQAEQATTAEAGADAQTVSRDATTGHLRNATPEEQAKLHANKLQRAARVAPKPMLQKYHHSGAKGVRVNDEFLSSSVAVRTPDGKIEMICNDTHGADSPAVPHVHAAPAPVTE